MAFSNKPIEKVIMEINNLGEFSEAKINTMRYVARTYVGEIEKFIIMLTGFWLLSHQVHYLLAAFAVMTVRPIGGGFHGKTTLSCLLWTSFGFLLAIFGLPYLISLNGVVIIIAAIFSILTSVMIAPLRSEQHEKRADVTKDKNKKITLFIINSVWFSLIFLNQDHALAPAVMWILFLQSFQLLAEYIRRLHQIKIKRKEV